MQTKHIRLNGPISFSLTSAGQMANGIDTSVTIQGRVIGCVQKIEVMTDVQETWSILDLTLADIPETQLDIKFLQELEECLNKPL
jgi:hypothetical protein